MRLCIIILYLFLAGCNLEDLSSPDSNDAKTFQLSPPVINSLILNNNQIQILGSNLENIEEATLLTNNSPHSQLNITSISSGQINLSPKRNLQIQLETIHTLTLTSNSYSFDFLFQFSPNNQSISLNKFSIEGVRAGSILRFNNTNWSIQSFYPLTLMGNWNAQTNSPDLSGNGVPNIYYIVSEPGNFDLNGGAGTNNWGSRRLGYLE